MPWLKLITLAEILAIAHDHLVRLEPHERRRLVQLVLAGRGRRRNLTPRQRDELAALVLKAEPRLFFGLTANKLSPFQLPERLIRGPRRRD